MKKLLFFSLFIITTGILFTVKIVNGQEIIRRPKVEEQCPDFILKDVHYYPSKSVQLSDFKGKWVVIDFWSRYCGACLASFPKMEKLRKEFDNRIQFIMIGATNRNGYNPTLKVYKILQEKYNLNLTVAYDSITSSRWGIESFPCIVIIDPKGTIRAITSSVSDKILNDLLSKKNPKIVQYGHKVETDTTFFNDPDNFVLRSLITTWNSNKVDMIFPSSISGGRILKLYGISLETLYKFAFIGQGIRNQMNDTLFDSFYPHLIFETKDTSYFFNNLESETGLYCYDLFLPVEESKESIMTHLQDDLNRSFPYDVKIERRRVPCWYLTISKDARKTLSTKGGTSQVEAEALLKLMIRNKSIKYIVNWLNGNFARSHTVFFDHTNISGNIDITVDTLLIDFEDVKTSLAKSGLILKKGDTIMKAIVVRDKQK